VGKRLNHGHGLSLRKNFQQLLVVKPLTLVPNFLSNLIGRLQATFFFVVIDVETDGAVSQ